MCVHHGDLLEGGQRHPGLADLPVRVVDVVFAVQMSAEPQRLVAGRHEHHPPGGAVVVAPQPLQGEVEEPPLVPAHLRVPKLPTFQTSAIRTGKYLS